MKCQFSGQVRKDAAGCLTDACNQHSIKISYFGLLTFSVSGISCAKSLGWKIYLCFTSLGAINNEPTWAVGIFWKEVSFVILYICTFSVDFLQYIEWQYIFITSHYTQLQPNPSWVWNYVALSSLNLYAPSLINSVILCILSWSQLGFF